MLLLALTVLAVPVGALATRIVLTMILGPLYTAKRPHWDKPWYDYSKEHQPKDLSAVCEEVQVVGWKGLTLHGMRTRGWDPHRFPTVVFVHGFPDNHTLWSRLITDTQSGGKVNCLALTLRGGHPNSFPADEDLTMYAAAQDVLALFANGSGADLPHDGSVHLVGHDWGGIVVQLAAKLDGADRFRSVMQWSMPHMHEYSKFALRDWRVALASWYQVFFLFPVLPERWLLSPFRLPFRRSTFLGGASASAVDDDVDTTKPFRSGLTFWINANSGEGYSPAYLKHVHDRLANPSTMRGSVGLYRANVLPFALDALLPSSFTSSMLRGSALDMVKLNSIPQMPVPTMIVSCGADGCLLPTSFDKTTKEEHFPRGLERVDVAGAGHWGFIEQPDFASQLLRRWITKHSVSAK